MDQSESKHYRFQGLEFYAQRGMVTIIDLERAGDSRATAHDALKRISAAELIKRAIAVRMQTNDKYPSMVRAANKFMDEAVAVAKIAKRQGDPTDPAVLADVARHRRRSSSLLLPGQELPPIGGARFALKLTTPRDMLLNGVQCSPDRIISSGSMITPEMGNRLRKPKLARR